jgi:hypothetical protein
MTWAVAACALSIYSILEQCVAPFALCLHCVLQFISTCYDFWKFRFFLWRIWFWKLGI